MTRRWCVVLCLFAWHAPLGAQDAVPANEAAVRAAARAYVDGFNAHDAPAVGKLWAEQAVYTDRTTGERTEGRAAIQADLATVFANQPQVRLQLDAGTVRFIRPDIAHAEATATVMIPDEDPSVVAVSAIYVKTGDQWLLDSVEEMNVPVPESAATALQDLEWLIGDWKDSAEGATSTSSFRWAAEGSFLVRSFTQSSPDDAVSEGTQVIGWDPRSNQIRSWTFNSDGSFGEAIWSRNGSDWMIKSTQTLADGGAAHGTYIVTPVDDNSMTVRLIGHEIDGEPQPTADAVRVMRVGAEQAAAPAQAAPQPAGGDR